MCKYLSDKLYLSHFWKRIIFFLAHLTIIGPRLQLRLLACLLSAQSRKLPLPPFSVCQTHEVSHKMSAPWGGCDGNLSDSMLISIIMMSMTATVMMMVLMMLMRMMMRTMMMMTIIVMMLQRTYFAMRIPGHKIRIL